MGNNILFWFVTELFYPFWDFDCAEKNKWHSWLSKQPDVVLYSAFHSFALIWSVCVWIFTVFFLILERHTCNKLPFTLFAAVYKPDHFPL